MWSPFVFPQSKLRDQELLQAAETGDVITLRRLLLIQDRDSVQVNCTDMLGRTPLNLAVANEHQEVRALCAQSFLYAAVYGDRSVVMCTVMSGVFIRNGDRCFF